MSVFCVNKLILLAPIWRSKCLCSGEQLRFMLSLRVLKGARCAVLTLPARAVYWVTQSSCNPLKPDASRDSSQRNTQVLAQLS